MTASRVCLFALTFGLLGAVESRAGDQIAAPGKHDFASTVAAEEFDISSALLVSEPQALPAPVVEPIRIEPVADMAEAPSFLRYNLEYLDVSGTEGYDAARFFNQTKSIGWDVAIAYGLTTALGMNAWEWGSADFRFKDEGWFGDDTKYGGVDKLGHAYTAYVLSDYFAQRIAHTTDDSQGAFVTGAILGFGIQTYVEVFDGFSGGHGFSKEDLIADAVGAGFSMLRNSVPGMREKLDFRLEYLPSGEKGFAPVTDYEGQKYLLALKLSGFEAFQDSPLRFVELQVGYFARGFSDEDRARGADRRREPYFAVGLNLNEVLNGTAFRDSTPGAVAARSFEYLQVPYTYVATTQD